MSSVEATVDVQRPEACSEERLDAFIELVRQGFPSAERLDERVREARWLAFEGESGAIRAIAALKSPDRAYRDEIFRSAEAPVDGDGYDLELGWVYVDPSHRGHRLAERVCRGLLERGAEGRVYSTTRPDNERMVRVLLSLGFSPVGGPFQRRDETLALFLGPRDRPTATLEP